tara:strand:- start:3486 stop:4754 length:1269 start_codon:yes stop_codon:yes gene_type:complete
MYVNWNHYVRFLTILIFFALPLSVSAQLSLSGEFRPRTELRNGYRILNTIQDDPAFFISQRTRLIFLFKDDLYTFKLSAQDLRIWGDETQLQDNANINIHEAWAQLNISSYNKVKLGRQELVYDDQRLLGGVDWSLPGRSHDAIVLKYENSTSDFNLDIGAAYNQERENVLGNVYTLNNYKVLSYLWMKKFMGAFDVSGIFLTDGFETPIGDTNYRYTYGTFTTYKINDLYASGTIYFQKGDDNLRKNISAYMVAGKVSYQLKATKLSIGIEYLSGGDVDETNPVQHSFNTLYATNHKFYGNMDYFLNIPNETKGGGLQDIYVNALYKSSKETTLNLTYYNFSLAQEVVDPANSSETLNKGLASEIDISFAYAFSKDISLQVGYSVLFSSDSLERIQQRSGNGLQQWGWVMLVLTPEFFTIE